ncbi:hypothetical protein [Faecalibacter bovis]|uniref:Uracil permease n=1 Tax=Faecalibacter bovis TaxID=2898187 RepID=A0ABX7XDC3_9FLAO|nr:hypothetical protein [Faecalibacter bovis]QTV05931.1 hypothetical protein J9309_00855 [Faecalibacter bovis]
MIQDSQMKMGVLCGTIFSIIGNLGLSDLLQTAILAGVGAFVSFVVSYILKKLDK